MRFNPHEVNTTRHFFNVCEGLRQGNEKECTVRLYCIVATEHNRWELTQEELDAADSSGSFWFNGLIEAGWFVEEDNKFMPTDKFFGRIMSEGYLA